ncbi:GntR family transcriptional regulator [Falsihalocynthiibacter sp. SS001]|uniref:GntR family transcriptional regulator n=1 Tax=Falsihalocynthiibacter sp. SS001 TaxID=3349698 RepID=UPI0036D2F8DB
MPLPASFAQFETTTTTDQAFKVIKSAVIRLELLPGSKISEAEVAKNLGISRQPVRDAFYRLSELGFLNIRPQKATTVTLISEQALLDARFNRTALEVECLREAMRKMTATDMDALKTLVAEQSDAIKVNNQLLFHELDDQLHKTIAEIAGHPNAWCLVKNQKVHLDRVRYMTLSKRAEIAHQEHVQIVESICNRDLAQAEERLRAHLYSVVRLVEDVRKAHPEYFDDAQ